MELLSELASLLAELEKDGIETALCGALALAVHGAPRATKDIDLIARRQDEAAVGKALERAGYRLKALPMRFASGIELQRFSKLIDGRPLMVDVMWAEGPLQPIWARRARLAWQHGTLQVVTREDLITLKLTAGRPQDLVDIQKLSALGEDDGT